MAEGSVRERVEFANGAELVYELKTGTIYPGASASFENGQISVVIGLAAAARWADSDQVGIEGENGVPEILIEKDFQCMHGEKDPEAYEGVPAGVDT